MKLQEECRQYRGMKAETALLKAQLRALENNSIDEQGQKMQLQKRIDEQLQHCANVDAAIACAPNAMLRAAMIMRYQLGMKWQDVASSCGENILADAIRKRVSFFLRSR